MAATPDGLARLERSVGIDAPIKHVWPALLDLGRVIPCLPGAEITHVDEAGVYHGMFRIKFGPRSAEYHGTIRIEAVNRGARTAVLAVSSSERPDRVARATVTGRADSDGLRTTLDVVTELPRTGRLGLLLGQSAIVEKASEHLLREFASRLAAVVTEPPADSTAARPRRSRPGPVRPAAPSPSRTPPVRSSAPGSSPRRGRARAARERARERARAGWDRLGGRLTSIRRFVPIARPDPARGWANRTCPRCLAGSGEPCRTTSGSAARRPHAARLEDPRLARRRRQILDRTRRR
jgi:carbon monoxide dehydrogenase subunit G